MSVIVPNSIYLIINADDLGLLAEIDGGIFALAELGRVTGASLLMNFPRLAETLKRLPDAPPLEVGLHLNLTWGASLTQANSLTENGRFLGGVKPLFKRYLQGGLKTNDLRQEIHTQMQTFRDAGLRGNHLDTHQHVWLIPSVARVIEELSPQFGFTWIRQSRENYTAPHGWKAWGLNAWVDYWVRPLKQSTPFHVAGVLGAGQWTPERLCQFLACTTNGIYELIVHPALPVTTSSPQIGLDRLATIRPQEKAALESSIFSDFLQQKAIHLTQFQELDKIQV